jgi:uncharacterized membrane protein
MTALIAQLLSVSSLSGTRAALTLLGLSVAAHMGYLELPEMLNGFDSVSGMTILALLAIFEEVQESDEDLQELLEWVNYGTRALAGGIAAWSVSAEADAEVVTTISPVLGAGVATGSNWVRTRLHEQMRGLGDSIMSPRTWLLWLERGGVLGLLTAAFLAPVIALCFILLATVAAAMATVTRRMLERKHFRRECPSCGHHARIEASLCPSCRGPLEVEKWLAQKSKAAPSL